jgi:hypothetical protein
MGEFEEQEDMSVIDYLVRENIIRYKSPPIKIEVDEKDFNFEMTDKEIGDATYISDRRQLYLPFGE